jgi:hypothetical protein
MSIDAQLSDRLSAAASAVERPSLGKGNLAWGRAFRAIVFTLQKAGTGGVPATKLRTVATREESGFSWTWAKTVLPWLPGIRHEGGGMWVYDADDAERNPPTVPENPSAPSGERIEDLVVASDFPGEGTRPAKHRTAVRKAYSHLIQNVTATCDDLRADAYVSGVDQPEQGHFTDREQWWRHVGRPALANLPGVRPPVIPGDEWVFVGIEPRGEADE